MTDIVYKTAAQSRIDRNHERNRLAQSELQFDGMSPKEAAEQIESNVIDHRMAIAATGDMRMAALKIVFLVTAMVADGSFDEADLLPSEALDYSMIEQFSDGADEDEELESIDDLVKTLLSAHIVDAFSTLGVEDKVIADIYDIDTKIADAAIILAADTVLENMPDDGEDLESFAINFAYTDERMLDANEEDEESEQSFDSMAIEYQFDAATKKKLRAGKKTVKKVNGRTITYKAVKAVRNGKVTVVNKRVMGNFIPTSKQRSALKKARKKAGMASSIRKQMRSLSIGIKRNIYKGGSAKAKSLQQAARKRHLKTMGR